MSDARNETPTVWALIGHPTPYRNPGVVGARRRWHSRPAAQRSRERSGGYVLLWVVAALTVMLIVAAAYAPDLQRTMQREREEEMLFRGQEIVEALSRFYRMTGNRFPTSLNQLTDGISLGTTHRIRFLRMSAVKDPMTNEDWKLVGPTDPLIKKFVQAYLKSVSQPTSPLLQAVIQPGAPSNTGGSGASGTLPGQQFGQGTQMMPGGTFQSQPGFQQSPSGFQQVQPGFQQQQSGFQSQPGFQQSPSGFQQVQPGFQQQQFGLQSQPGFGQQSSGLQRPGANLFNSFSSDSNEEDKGGGHGPILGVVSKSEKKSVRVYYDLDQYNDWAFIFIPPPLLPEAVGDARVKAFMNPIMYPSDPLLWRALAAGPIRPVGLGSAPGAPGQAPGAMTPTPKGGANQFGQFPRR